MLLQYQKLLSPTQLAASLVTNSTTTNNNSKVSYDMIRHINKIWKQILTDKQLINVNNHSYFHSPINLPNIKQMNNKGIGLSIQ